MQTKIAMWHYFMLTKMAIDNQRITSVGKDIEKIESPYTAGGKANGVVTLENREAVPQMMKHRMTI